MRPSCAMGPWLQVPRRWNTQRNHEAVVAQRSDVGQPPLRTRRLQWRSRPQTTHCTVSRFFPRDSGEHPSAEPGHLPLSRSRARKLHRPATRPRAYASAHAPASRQLRPGQAKKDFCCKSVAIFFKSVVNFLLDLDNKDKGVIGGAGAGRPRKSALSPKPLGPDLRVAGPRGYRLIHC